MSDNTFELGKPAYYEVQNIAEIEEFDQDDYGNTWYNVKFVGDANTFIWLAKNKPEEGKKYYGHLELSKSGKSTRFKTDKVPQDAPVADTGKPAYKDNSKSITLGLVWKILIGIQGVPTNDEEFAKFYETVDAHVSELLTMGEKL